MTQHMWLIWGREVGGKGEGMEGGRWEGRGKEGWREEGIAI
jgi:hypothetical protein